MTRILLAGLIVLILVSIVMGATLGRIGPQELLILLAVVLVPTALLVAQYVRRRP
ncbi:hypothetical protein [Salsipaludibacter albus]|uniref:hypothetical protein n=1 Tax=Salsipaludibacter albus TaxID=2849650 RepID=UPI001EE4CC12|nr:hypothetical protein [Salsipaludibacter albus]MBY5162985.1 hypothetical protein [Salsipaludibacter albus]